jgi:hypothetical protein
LIGEVVHLNCEVTEARLDILVWMRQDVVDTTSKNVDRSMNGSCTAVALSDLATATIVADDERRRAVATGRA